MSIDSKYLNLFIKATEQGAIGASKFIGKDDKIAADKGAVDLMRKELNKINMEGTVVIGEGEMDEAPMLYIGEEVGTKSGPFFDIALDPLEGTNFVAKNQPNSFSMLAVAEKGNIFSAPDTYMEKIAVGSGYPDNLLDLDNSIEKNITILSDVKKTSPKNLTVCLLQRPRHIKIINSLKKMNVKINFIQDGDVSGAIAVVDESSPVDMYIGVGGGPEGVLAAAALSCLGGQMQTRLILNADEAARAKKLGISDPNKKYNLNEMIKGDVMFFATAITNGELVDGIKVDDKSFTTSTFVLHKDTKTNKKIKNTFKK